VRTRIGEYILLEMSKNKLTLLLVEDWEAH
jgi:hypothetical protein